MTALQEAGELLDKIGLGKMRLDPESDWEKWLSGIMLCPECGWPLETKHGYRGPFIGCTGYPQCEYTEDIE
jgi:hypothetical protein